jgi:fructokinase
VLTVLGEAIVDLVDEGGLRFRAHAGGSPLNVAVGLGRLGHPTSLLARLSRDRFGEMFRQHLAASAVSPRDLVDASQPSTLAVARVDADGRASYDFWTEGTADWQWTAGELASPLADDVLALHTGSLATALPPGAVEVAALLARLSGEDRVLLSYDPNVRPVLLGEPAAVRPQIEGLIGLVGLVKVSVDDLAWLYPGVPAEVVLKQWAAAGPGLVVVTLGPDGTLALTAAGTQLRRPAVPVSVVDTVGAGDAFSAGLLGGLAERGLVGPGARGRLATLPAADLARLLDRASLVAALTCARPGADPPTAAEVTAAERAAAAVPAAERATATASGAARSEATPGGATGDPPSRS